MKNRFLLLFVFLAPSLLFSQEIMTGLYTNPVIQAHHKKFLKEKHTKNDTIALPFKDDFSGRSIFPDTSLWADNFVYINSAIPYMPPTIGVATFDALNDTGALYTEANAYGFIADSLTSKRIRLTGLKKTDSLYFSFMYQPQGIGNAPETDDSLVLEFYSPVTTKWQHIWSSPGMTLAQFNSLYHCWFKPVIISILDSANYYNDGFRFRFYNYASLANNNYPTWAGNADNWNLDYVYLDKNRNFDDTIPYDVAFMEPAPSLLKNYQSMPWSQYLVNAAGEMKDSLHLTIANLYSSVLQNDFWYDIYDENGTAVKNYSGGACNIYPYATNGPQNCLACCVHSDPILGGFTFPANAADSASFLLQLRLKMGTTGDNLRNNDTTVFNQLFYNYYAYDDGIPEAGYGLTPANALLAYKFTLNQPDTLRAVKMFFNQTLNNASQQPFYLTIWKDDNGKPGDTLYQQKALKPFYEDSLNKYYNYRLTRNIPVTGSFYVGWKQLTDANLNLGFDLNNDDHTKMFYNIGNGWTNSLFHGALMIRPVVGKALPLVAGIDEVKNNAGGIKVYPNPSAGELISVVLPEELKNEQSQLTTRILDLLGNTVYDAAYTRDINVAGLQDGIYLLTVDSPNHAGHYFTKLSIIK